MPAAEPSASPPRRVLIDLGHGVRFPHGYDLGARSHGAVEEKVVEQIGEKLKARLEAEGYEVQLSRGDEGGRLNRKRQLLSRADAADALNADMFVSLHANAHRNPRTRGVEIFVSRKDEGESRDLAKALRDSMGGGKIAGSRFVMLEESIHEDRPAVLIETGYLTNRDDRHQLITEQGQEAIAAEIALGISQYFSEPAPLLAEGTPNHGLPSSLENSGHSR